MENDGPRKPTDAEKAAQMAVEVKALRIKLNDPATTKREKAPIRLKIDTLFWMMERLDPAKYGKKIRTSSPEDAARQVADYATKRFFGKR